MRIGIVGEVDNNELSRQTYESIMKVSKLSFGNVALEIDLILVDANETYVKTSPCKRVYLYNRLSGNNPVNKTVEVIEHYYQHHNPALVVVALTRDADSIVPKAAVRINKDHNNAIAGFLECEDIQAQDKLCVVKPVYGGNVMAYYSIEHAAIISFNCSRKSEISFQPMTPEINHVDYSCHCPNSDVYDLDVEYITQGGLEDAEFVVVCGRGVGSKEAVEDIANWAATVGAAIGGTKKVIDHGWLKVHQLIGQTGHAISPKTCLVIGASGATPFMNGIVGSEKIIAINNDKSARIFDYADIGIVEDYKVVIEELKSQSTTVEKE